MISHQVVYPKEKLRKCFLAIAVIFSIFSFSGSLKPIQNQQKQPIQTELLSLNRPEVHKKTVFYNPILFSETAVVYSSNYNRALIVVNRIIHVELNAILGENYLRNSDRNFLRLKPIPKISEEELLKLS